MDTSEEIERSFGDGPPHRPVEELITAGRRLVVRRRIARGVCAAAAVLIVGSAAWMLASDPTSSTEPGPDRVATQPTRESPHADHSGEGDAGRKGEDPQSLLFPGELATYTGDNEVFVRKGWRVSKRIQNPLGLYPPAKSVGLELTNGTKTYWYLLESEDGGMSDPAGKSAASFDAWIADAVALMGGKLMMPVEFRTGSAELVGINGATIVRQHPDPDVPGFAEPGDTTAVAQVRWTAGIYFVLARQSAGGDPKYFPTPASTVPGGPTMESFLEHARAQYGSGDGLR